MPYNRKYRKRTTTKRKTDGKKALAMCKNLKKTLKPELKYYVSAITAVGLTNATWLSVILNGVAQGVSSGQRIGSDIRARYLNIRGSLSRAIGATSQCSSVRVSIVKVPAVGSAFPGTDTYATINPYSFRDLQFTNELTVVWSKLYQLTDNSPCRVLNIYKKLNNKCVFDLGVATVRKNQYVLVACSDEVLNFPILDTNNSYSFTDI